MRRVVITGLGIVAPTGNNVKEAWENAVAGRSGTARISLYDPTGHRVQVAGEVKNLKTEGVIDPKDANRLSRFIVFATMASDEALKDSGLPLDVNQERNGCVIGVGMGGIADIEESTKILLEKGEKRISPFFIPYAIPNMAAGYVSIQYQLRGPNTCTATACSSGTHAIGEAFRYIRDGMADAMVCGGAESAISPLGIASFAALKALSTNNDDPVHASRPFDLNRDGFVMGEGAGILVLEELESAKKRGAKIYAEVIGYGLSGDGHHITAPRERGEGGRRCMKMALDSAGLMPDDIDYINAHGTSTKINDQYESEAIMDLFGPHAYKLAISSTKGVTGHCLGAAGGIEAVYTALTIHRSLVPPTANFQTPDPDCPLDYTVREAAEKKVRVALSNSFGFGGTNATIAFRRFH
jgi:3-oxoacyl-[acyl-carrier-protein] synthase II